MADPMFDPFNDRLSRDIRNDLSESLLTCLRERRLLPARAVADRYLACHPAPVYAAYIQDRLERYGRFLAGVADDETDPLRLGFALWDLGLHFEVHEVLEQAWLRAAGEDKALFQALIRAAGVMIKRECGLSAAAAKMAAKARPVLERHRARLAACTAVAALLRMLESEG